MVFTRKVQVTQQQDGKPVTLAEFKGAIREIEVYPGQSAEWWLVPIAAGRASDLRCDIETSDGKTHAELGMPARSRSSSSAALTSSSPGVRMRLVQRPAYRYLVHHHLVGDAAQRGFLLDRPDRRLLQDRWRPPANRSPGAVMWISCEVDRLCTRAAILTVWPK